MTTEEARHLNRDIKRLWKRFEIVIDAYSVNVYGKERQDLEIAILEREWKRLWALDPKADFVKVEQLKAMIRINNVMRYMVLHWVGINFEPNL